MKRLSLSVKLVLAFALVGAVAVANSLVAVAALNQVQHGVTSLVESDLPSVKAIQTVRSCVDYIDGYENALCIAALTVAEVDAVVKGMGQRQQTLGEAIKVYESLVDAGAEATECQGMKAALEIWSGGHAKLVELSSQYRTTQAKADYDALLAQNNVTTKQAESVRAIVAKLVEYNDKSAAAVGASSRAIGASGRRLMTGLACLALLLSLGLATVVSRFIERTVTGPVKVVIAGMASTSQQVASASTQVASSAQQLASGAGQQASSLEETSASLEEIASMTQTNADNVGQANVLATKTLAASDRGNEAMARMTDAIGRINTSSAQTAKILKTIDEIAFQTNLLALNAAVEAARAGDAGKGFAVVAEEVRSLAQRSAQASRSTADLIGESQSSAADGVSAADALGALLSEIGGQARQVSALVAEVAAASREQTQGVSQVTKAVAMIDGVTQSNAASAEEAASASEELSAQAEQLSSLVNQLANIVGASSVSTASASTRPPAMRPANRPAPAAPVRSSNGHSATPILELDVSDF